MKIAVIGAGNVGSALASALSDKGHSVILGTGTDLKEHKLNGQNGIKTATTANAATEAEILIIAVHPPKLEAACKQIGKTDKLIIDCCNTIFEKPGGFVTASEAIAHWTGSGHVVKCFNTAGANIISNTDFDGVLADTYMAGGTAQHKELVGALAKDAGFARAVDCGDIENAKLLEDLAGVWVGLVMKAGFDRTFAFKLLER